MLIRTVKGAARAVNLPLLMKPKNVVQHTAYKSLLLKPKGSWSSTSFPLCSMVGVTGSLDCDTLGRTRWMPLMTKWIRGEVVGGGSNPMYVNAGWLPCASLVYTDTVCTRWAVYMMSVHSCAGNGAMLSWLQNFRNDLWAD